VEEAIACYRKAIEIDPHRAEAHCNLGLALDRQGKLDQASECFRTALQINPHLAEAHGGLGIALDKQGKRDEAITCLRRAIQIDPRLANAHGALGQALMRQGQFRAAQQSFDHCLALLADDHPLRPTTLRLRRQCRQGLAVEGKLKAFLAGKGAPAEAATLVQMASVAQLPVNQFNVTAARLYRDAFARQPALAGAYHYHAARAAALAGTGQGKDAAGLADAERARWRQQALDWLRAELAALTQLLQKQPERARAVVQRAMRHWQQDADLAGVRGEDLAKLPEAQRQPWQQLWADVEQTLQKTVGRDTEASKKRPAK
jgi:tetratricopeptide (TPR) repeat protein